MSVKPMVTLVTLHTTNPTKSVPFVPATPARSAADASSARSARPRLHVVKGKQTNYFGPLLAPGKMTKFSDKNFTRASRASLPDCGKLAMDEVIYERPITTFVYAV